LKGWEIRDFGGKWGIKEMMFEEEEGVRGLIEF
jgi:hypothetical protein